MEIGNFRKVLRRTLAIPMVILVLLAVTLVIEVLSLTTSLHQVEHTNQVIENSRMAIRLMLEMDSSVRGYDLTGDQEFLQHFERAKIQLPSTIDNLVQLTGDNALQQSRLKDIRDLDKGWMQWADQEIAQHKNRPPSENDLFFGERLMNEIRTRQRELVDEETRLLKQRSQTANGLGRVVLVTALVLLLTLGLVLLLPTRKTLEALAGSYQEHLEAEAERTQQLQESRESYRITLNSLAEAVIASDAQACITFSNPVAQQLTGWTDIESQGRPVSEVVYLIDERTRTRLPDPLRQVAGPDKLNNAVCHLAMVDRHGREFPVEVNAAPIMNDQRQPVGSVIVFRDITQRRQTEHTLLVSERLTQAGRLSATIAHEIRNPLDTVANLIYLMQHENSPGLVTQQYLQMAGEELARITQITGQLLTFHREARNPVQVNLQEVIDSVLTLFAPQIRKGNIRIEKRFQSPPRVRGFPGELRQVFSNLVGNAIDAMPGGGMLIIRVRESAAANDGTCKGVRVTVLDSGTGISPGVRRNLFAPFYTTKGEKGTGLGLWVSRGIIEKHEGTIQVVSSVRPGRTGTAFSIFLPYEQVLGKLEVPRTLPGAPA
jgi:PAS domain S-box-containing protein